MAVQHLNRSDDVAATPLIEVRNAEVLYNNAIVALQGVSLSVPEGGFVCVLGANGAGKTTIVRAITGILGLYKGRLREGSVHFRGERLDGQSPQAIVGRGICQVPEGRKLFARLTVEENLLCGAATRKDRKEITEDVERMLELFPRIAHRRKDQAGFLSGGEQQMVAVGRALMARPKLLVCDELSLGLAPMVVQSLFELIAEIRRERDVSVLMIEQNARLALDAADYGYVLETGRVVAEGSAEALRNDPQVVESYLGGSGEAKAAFEAVKHLAVKGRR